MLPAGQVHFQEPVTIHHGQIQGSQAKAWAIAHGSQREVNKSAAATPPSRGENRTAQKKISDGAGRPADALDPTSGLYFQG